MMRIWRWPVAIALASALGLIAGLVSEGAGDWLSWLALGLPTALGLQGLWRGRGQRSASLSRPVPRRAGRG
ncbi:MULTISPECIES: hypothetical protein [Stutzerimonas]|uniref:hypothetical protein n=1 Tax=Stutzerimonas TaxID=2901164 RepID=UPI00190A493D|nr:hypothetical protein [Stutzerimonas balearica]MBK3746337.1 hypothetical protein [Stutzerimonas balearica]MBK3824533.1 hypothetical protein [Stutzerimonas balearica]MBK3854224.1 hypothetical protein [Stutzerimonas balearica]